MAGDWPIVLSARLENGVVVMNRRRMEAALKGRRDCELEVVIERKHATRSLAQNRLYFGVYCKVLSEHTGYTVEEIHEALKAKFLPKHIGIGRHEVVVGQTTTRLNKIEFGEYLKAIQQWAAEELDVNIPDPPSADEQLSGRTREGAHA